MVPCTFVHVKVPVWYKRREEQVVTSCHAAKIQNSVSCQQHGPGEPKVTLNNQSLNYNVLSLKLALFKGLRPSIQALLSHKG